MLRGAADADDRIQAAITAFGQTPLRGGWPGALTMLANLVGGWAAVLFTVSPSNGLLSFACGGVREEVIRAGAAAGGADPKVNPRMAALRKAVPMRVFTEEDFAGAWRESPYRQDFADPAGNHHGLFAKLTEREDEFTGLVVWRSAQQGPATDEEREAFAKVLPAVRQAHGRQLELERRVLRLAAHLWEQDEKAVFYIDANLKLLASSTAADDLIANGEIISLTGERLHFPSESLQHDFQKAVALASSRCAERNSTTSLDAVGADGSRKGAFLVMPPVPEGEENDLLLISAALVFFVEERSARLDAVDSAVRLTRAEQDIGRKLLRGLSTRQIAISRGAAISTVQTQIKAMNQKLGAAHRAELVGLLRKIFGE